MKKNLVEARLIELTKDLSAASIYLNEQKESIKVLQIKVYRIEGARIALRELLLEIEEAEKTMVPDSI